MCQVVRMRARVLVAVVVSALAPTPIAGPRETAIELARLVLDR